MAKRQVILTQALVKTLPPGNYPDPATPNFGLVVGKKRRTYYIRIYESGARPKITIGRADGPSALTLKVARKTANEKLSAHGDGAVLRRPVLLESIALKQMPAGALTMDQLMKAFILEHSTNAPVDRRWSDSHLANQKFYANRIVGAALGDARTASITRSEIRQLEKTYALQAPTSANRLHAFLSRLFNWADEEELVDHLPGRIRKQTTEDQRERVLEDSELRRFWEALDALEADPETSRRDRMFVNVWRLRLLTAQRERALRRIEWAWVNFDKKEIVFPGTSLKGKQGRRRPLVLPLAPLALAIFAKRRVEASPMDKFVFGTRDATAKAPGRTRGVPLALPDFQGKDLRRTASTLMRANGIERFIVKKVLNHAVGDVTDVYDRYECIKEKRHAVQVLERALLAIFDPKRARKTRDNVVPMRRR